MIFITSVRSQRWIRFAAFYLVLLAAVQATNVHEPFSLHFCSVTMKWETPECCKAFKALILKCLVNITVHIFVCDSLTAYDSWGTSNIDFLVVRH
jgi:hypothetical protein